jgi:RimJ/RimL family protein N-acetyltransferase
MKLQPLTANDCETIRQWRNENLIPWRTPYPLTDLMQDNFYKNIVSNPDSPHRYWAIYEHKQLIGMGGITNIQWENSIGEITLLINPSLQHKGYGEKAVELLLDNAFNRLNLQTVFGECYESNPAATFWAEITEKYNGYRTSLPNRKYWDGRYWDSLYFSIDRDNVHKGA